MKAIDDFYSSAGAYLTENPIGTGIDHLVIQPCIAQEQSEMPGCKLDAFAKPCDVAPPRHCSEASTTLVDNVRSFNWS
jgi:hypothetical protein